ncbi:hypothetical protein Hrubri_2322 [Herbaspirillum rubrisubalbicans M1]|uniref:type VI secretion system protein TssA n=1 Tax=Herbaspirillum rubrisubalbicans TaxID=80842 RepID=UPI000739F8F8|nr:type VI secretion system protein TssA [Herbaspirillum rubrisubalbicans]ALU89507.1 hypothetical protein Hrubri_2322 [Herbaspirillum rubrisubalbicans M1]
MSDYPELDATSDGYFQAHLHVSLADLLAPVDSEHPAGQSLRGGPVYGAISQARRQDDASLPMGSWQHELKRADWHKVEYLCAQALTTQSKDLQLAAWLLEAQINQSGFDGIGPCLHLMQRLCQGFWDGLYPKSDQDELEHRANIFQWVNDKLLPLMRLVPLTATEQPRQYNWADWELARRYEQAKAAQAAAQPQAQRPPDNSDVASVAQITAALADTATAFLQARRAALDLSLGALEALTQTIDPLFGTEAPGMQALQLSLQQIRALFAGELQRRGFGAIPPAIAPAASPEGSAVSDPLHGAPVTSGQPHPPPAAAIRDRMEAYARLAETAQFLMQLEPHSPVPYLVKRATEWGQMNTVDLYQELFLRLGGQLNIFEMLGLSQAESPEKH